MARSAYESQTEPISYQRELIPNIVEHIKDLFGIERFTTPKGPSSERSTLIKYFSEQIERPAKYVGIRLAHYSLDQLYGLKSAYADRLTRNDRTTAQKFWWYITKTEKV